MPVQNNAGFCQCIDVGRHNLFGIGLALSVEADIGPSVVIHHHKDYVGAHVRPGTSDHREKDHASPDRNGHLHSGGYDSWFSKNFLEVKDELERSEEQLVFVFMITRAFFW